MESFRVAQFHLKFPEITFSNGVHHHQGDENYGCFHPWAVWLDRLMSFVADFACFIPAKFAKVIELSAIKTATCVADISSNRAHLFDQLDDTQRRMSQKVDRSTRTELSLVSLFHRLFPFPSAAFSFIRCSSSRNRFFSAYFSQNVSRQSAAQWSAV